MCSKQAYPLESGENEGQPWAVRGRKENAACGGARYRSAARVSFPSLFRDRGFAKRTTNLDILVGSAAPAAHATRAARTMVLNMLERGRGAEEEARRKRE